VEVDKETAVRYLQRSDLAIDTPTKGWNLVQYQGHNIGWINALSNRINNYYPKEFRILKQRQDIGFEK
jgi:NOL1/NOP2/fmu family ribosome biogenesis protein